MLGAVHEYRMLVLENHLDTFGHVNDAASLQIAGPDGPGGEARP
jgi:hypothetical protein